MIDKRKNYYMILDTETCPIEQMQQVNAHNMLVYDIGYIIIDKLGTIYKQGNYVVNEIFYGEQNRMKSAYYCNKLPQYYIDIKNGIRTVKNLNTIKQDIENTINEYKIKSIICHNAYFDYTALQTTLRYITQNNKANFFNFNVEIWDTMKMSNDTICKQKGYKTFCLDNNYITKNGQVRKTAEILYRYITGDNNFTEQHTGLQDTLIESKIFVHCMKQHKKMKKLLFNEKATT